MAVRYAILGPIEVSLGGDVLPIGAGRQRAVLALLLLHANEAVSTERIIDQLWGDAPPPTASKVVQNSVSQLRKVLEVSGSNGLVAPVLVTKGRGYQLRVAPGELDTEHFEALLDEGRRALASGDPTRSAAVLREALALWRGPPLADVSYEAFAQTEIARLEERRLTALEERVDADFALGRHADLVAELEQLVADHPSRERLAGQLMLALYRCGRQSEALDVHQRVRRALVDELGLEPGPSLRRLHEAILHQDPALEPPEPSEPRPAPRRVAFRDPVGGELPGRVSRRVAIAGAVLLAAAGAAGVIALHRGGESAGLATAAGDSVAAVDPTTNRIVASVPVGHAPSSISVGQGAAWVLNADDQTLSRVDAASKQVTTFGLGSPPTDVAAGAGVIWVGAAPPAGPESSGAQPDRVLRLDAASRITQAVVSLPSSTAAGQSGAPHQLAVDPSGVWAIGSGPTLTRIDPTRNSVAARVPGLLAGAVAAGPEGVWALAAQSAGLTAQQGTTLVRIDPRTSRVARRVHLQASRLDDIAVGAGAIWAADRIDGTLWRVDPGPTVVTRTIPVGAGADSVAVGAGSVWVLNSVRGTLSRVDPGTNLVTAVIPIGRTPRAVSVGAGRVWVSVASGPATVPSTGHTGAVAALPRSACGPVLSAGGRPRFTIASDLPLHEVQSMADAIAVFLRQRGFRAGPYSIGYQSCDDSTAVSGTYDVNTCIDNAKLFGATSSVIGVVGPLNSACAAVEIPILNRASGGPLALVSPTSSLDGLTRSDPTGPPGATAALYPTGQRNYARVYPTNLAQGVADAMLVRELGRRRVFILDDGSDYGAPLAVHFRQASAQIGLEVAGSAMWDANGIGFPALAERIRRANADSVYLSGVAGSSGGELVYSLRRGLGPGVTLVAPDAFGPIWLLMDASRGAARGMYVTNPGVPLGRVGTVGRRFERDFGKTQPAGAVRQYDLYAAQAATVLLDAIARSNGTRASVVRALFKTHLTDGPLGPVTFDQYGDVRPAPIAVLRVERRIEDISDAFKGATLVGVLEPPAQTLR